MARRTDVIPVGVRGYRGSALSREYLNCKARNISLHGDTPQVRFGYSIRRQIASATASFFMRIPVDSADGTLHTAFQHMGIIYEDAASPTARDSTLTNPYAAATNRIPQILSLLGRTIYVNGTDADFRVLVWVGSALKVKPVLVDPGTPTVSTVAGGAMPTVQRFVRIRWYDSETGTYSGPSQRTAGATSATPAAGNLIIKVVRPAAPSRPATHWQVEFATVDSPSSYQIHADPEDAAGVDIVGVTGSGLIPIATTDAYFDVVEASGAAFESRDDVFRHANPPTGAALLCHYQGRVFYAAANDTWLAWSETDNPEHFYTDPTSPHAGLNTVDGEGVVDTVLSPCMALAATELALYFLTRTGVVLGEGTWEIINGERQAHLRVLSQNHLGAITSQTLVVDQDLYFVSQEGPKVLSGGGVLDLDCEAIREEFAHRDPVYDHRMFLGYEPDTKHVLISFAPKVVSITGIPQVVLPWCVDKRMWSTPWDLHVTSMTLHRYSSDAGVSRGMRLFFGGPYGAMNEYGFGHADGALDSDADTRVGLNSTAASTTTATVTGKAWTVDAYKSCSLVLVDRTTGRWYPRTIKTNSADVITWEGAVSHSGGGWTLYIGGYGRSTPFLVTMASKDVAIRRALLILRDPFSALGA